MNWFVFVIIFVVLAVIVSNIMLLKHSAKMSFKNLNQDPIENAKKELARRKHQKSHDDMSKHKGKTKDQE